ncbi:MAG: hypothetical protein GY801_51510 [bacterium]|nr:hypothetical protein [bacterium]
MKEYAIRFGTAASLIGIITEPEATPETTKLPGVILLNSGLLPHTGPNRLYVKIARRLAAQGFVALRFDLSGIGDSGVRRDHLPAEKSAVSETCEAMDYLQSAKGVERFILSGICSGAVNSYDAACCDDRVVGVVPINAYGRLHDEDEALEASLQNPAYTRHYWRILLHSSFRVKNWKKALAGRIMDYRGILTMMFASPLKLVFHRSRQRRPVQNAIVTKLPELSQRGVRLFLIHAEGDEGLDYLHVAFGKELESWIAAGIVKFEVIQGANHTFTLLWSQEHLIESILNWAQKFKA